ncbi:unnamed protein product, partial [Allacma fusca]
MALGIYMVIFRYSSVLSHDPEPASSSKKERRRVMEDVDRRRGNTRSANARAEAMGASGGEKCYYSSAFCLPQLYSLPLLSLPEQMLCEGRGEEQENGLLTCKEKERCRKYLWPLQHIAPSRSNQILPTASFFPFLRLSFQAVETENPNPSYL